MANNGEKINHQQRGEIFRLLDLFNKVYENIKFVDKSEIVPIL